MRVERLRWTPVSPALVRVRGDVVNPSAVTSADDVYVRFLGYDSEGRLVARGEQRVGHLCRGPLTFGFDFRVRCQGAVERGEAEVFVPRGH